MSIEDNQHRKKNNYKLLVDPELQKGKKKLYRLNGAIPGKQPIPDPKDPRVVKTVLGAAGKDLELPIPRFKVPHPIQTTPHFQSHFHLFYV
jgi:hypothetical protein